MISVITKTLNNSNFCDYQHLHKIAKYLPPKNISAYVMCYTAYIMRYTAYVMRYTAYVMRYTAYVMRYTAYVMRYTAYVMRYTACVMCYTLPLFSLEYVARFMQTCMLGIAYLAKQ